MADSEFKDRAFFNAQDGITGRDGGPYLDQVERVNAEIRRAFLEGRDARSFEELLGEALPAATGTDLRIAALVPDNRLTSNPSMANQPGLEQSITDETFTENQRLADPVSVLQVDVAGTTDTNPTFEDGTVEESGGGKRAVQDNFDQEALVSDGSDVSDESSAPKSSDSTLDLTTSTSAKAKK